MGSDTDSAEAVTDLMSSPPLPYEYDAWTESTAEAG
jgi:hypothetical protein